MPGRPSVPFQEIKESNFTNSKIEDQIVHEKENPREFYEEKINKELFL